VGRDEDAEAGRGGRGEVAGAKSSVGTSSGLLGAPQAEQKRPVAGTSVPQDEHEAMIFTDTVYRFGAGMCSMVLPKEIARMFQLEHFILHNFRGLSR
jgi:hypothetical protein